MAHKKYLTLVFFEENDSISAISAAFKSHKSSIEWSHLAH